MLYGGRESKSVLGASVANAIAARISMIRLIQISCGFENNSSLMITEHKKTDDNTVRLTVRLNLRKL